MIEYVLLGDRPLDRDFLVHTLEHTRGAPEGFRLISYNRDEAFQVLHGEAPLFTTFASKPVPEAERGERWLRDVSHLWTPPPIDSFRFWTDVGLRLENPQVDLALRLLQLFEELTSGLLRIRR